MQMRNTDISMAGMVSTYFQLASHTKCMKKAITSRAFVQETAIMNAQPTVRGNMLCHQSKYVRNEKVVSTQRARKTRMYFPTPW